MSDVVMSGSLGAFDVPSILQAMSLSRQYTRLRLWSTGDAKTGEIRMKAGQILQAQSNALVGKDAFSAILHGKHATFSVERCKEPEQFPQPLGTIASLLLSAHDAPANDDLGSTLSGGEIFEDETEETQVAATEPEPAPSTPPVVARADVPPAKPRPAVPTPSSPPAAKAPPVKIAPAAAAPRVQVREIDQACAQHLRACPGLHGVAVADFGRKEHAFEWKRDRESSRFNRVTKMTLAMINCLEPSQQGAVKDVRVSLELEDLVLVGECLGNARVLIYAFDSQLPLGLIRHHCKRLQAEIRQSTSSAQSKSGVAV